MRSIFLVFGAFAYASEECADESTLLQGGMRGRKAKQASSKDALAELRKVASSLTERSAIKLGREEVDQALATARDALEAISPTIYGQVTQAQTQINDAGAAVQVCHAQSGIDQRAELLTQVQTKAADLQTCQAELATLTSAAEAQCAIAQDCLCDEANVRRDDKEILCASKQEVYELAFCEHNMACTTFGTCHEQEYGVYVALQNDVEAEMEVVTQEYITVQQSSCLMALIQTAIAAGQPIDSAAMLQCNVVDTTAMTIVYPTLPAAPAACPAAAVGNPSCAGMPDWTMAVSLTGSGTVVETDIGQAEFNDLFNRCPVVKYTRNAGVHSVYVRRAGRPEVDAFKLFTYLWASSNNVLGTDFDIYDNEADARSQTGAWSFCNYDDPDVGYGRDCGKTGYIANTWFTMPSSGQHDSSTGGGAQRFDIRNINNGASFEIYTGSSCPQ